MEIRKTRMISSTLAAILRWVSLGVAILVSLRAGFLLLEGRQLDASMKWRVISVCLSAVVIWILSGYDAASEEKGPT
jgi:hypothetical protein